MQRAQCSLHDVGLVHSGHGAASVVARVVEGEIRHAVRRVLRDELDALDDPGDDLVLNSYNQEIRNQFLSKTSKLVILCCIYLNTTRIHTQDHNPNPSFFGLKN